jgi:hypothetical protein
MKLHETDFSKSSALYAIREYSKTSTNLSLTSRNIKIVRDGCYDRDSNSGSFTLCVCEFSITKAKQALVLALV